MTATAPPARSAAWKWYVCILLMLATMINYMDRQTLSQVKTDIKHDFERRGIQFTDEDYGDLESAFAVAFALGAILNGLLVDYFGIRWYYPLVLVGWSAAGFATAYANDYQSLFWCRVLLGLFESGQWPCALKTSQTILTPRDRTLGNGLLQSGAAMGAVITPQIIKWMMGNDSTAWREPFQVIGMFGVAWVVPWLLLVRSGDLRRSAISPTATDKAGAATLTTGAFARRFSVVIVMVIAINLCWHFFRAWLPSFLREHHDYKATEVADFTTAFYLATDCGSLSVGFVVRWLTARGWSVYAARLSTYGAAAVLTCLTIVAAGEPRGPMLIGVLLVIGFGALALFPNYYSFSQDLTIRHQGKLTGVTGCTTWLAVAVMQHFIGKHINETESYAEPMILAGLAPMLGLLAMVAFWHWPAAKRIEGSTALRR